MKRTILFALLLSLVAISASAQKAKAPKRQGFIDGEECPIPIYGKVKSVEFTAELYQSQGELDVKIEGNVKFNNRGDITELTGALISPKSSEKGLTSNKYNVRGNIISTTSKANGSLEEKTLYKYDSKGNMVEAASYNSDGDLSKKNTYKYDSQGNVIEESKYRFDGSLRNTIIHKYDSKGKLIEFAINSDDMLIPFYKYEARGTQFENTVYSSNGSPQGKALYKYDQQGNLIELTLYNPDGTLLGCGGGKYDSHGNITEIAAYQGEAKIPMFKFKTNITYR